MRGWFSSQGREPVRWRTDLLLLSGIDGGSGAMAHRFDPRFARRVGRAGWRERAARQGVSVRSAAGSPYVEDGGAGGSGGERGAPDRPEIGLDSGREADAERVSGDRVADADLGELGDRLA